MCRDYDRFCPRCGSTVAGHEGVTCSGDCANCEHDMPHGCAKPHGVTDASFHSSPYPYSVVEKKGKLYMIEDTDKRNKIGTIVLALLPTGAFGIHDFYARRYLWAMLHMSLIILDIAACVCKLPLDIAGFWLSWAGAVVEAVLIIVKVIKTDGKGFPFA